MAVKHAFTSAKDDGADETVVRPTNWNADHTVDQAIADNDVLTVDDADAADNDYAKFTAVGIEGRSYAEVREDLDLEIGTDVLAQSHADLTTGVHGAGANTLLYSNHNAILSSTIHPDTSLCRYYLGADVANIPSSQTAKIELDTLLYDLGSNFDAGDWYGADGAYRQSKNTSISTRIDDDTADFPVSPSAVGIVHSLVRWASDAAGTTNVGTGYVTASTATSLTIVKATGADFAASYYYYIKNCHYVAPVAGAYQVTVHARIDPTEDQKRYFVRMAKGDIQIMDSHIHASGTGVLLPLITAIAYLAKDDFLNLKVFASDIAGTMTIKGGPNEGHASWTSLTAKLLQAT